MTEIDYDKLYPIMNQLLTSDIDSLSKRDLNILDFNGMTVNKFRDGKIFMSLNHYGQALLNILKELKELEVED